MANPHGGTGSHNMETTERKRGHELNITVLLFHYLFWWSTSFSVISIYKLQFVSWVKLQKPVFTEDVVVVFK